MGLSLAFHSGPVVRVEVADDVSLHDTRLHSKPERSRDDGEHARDGAGCETPEARDETPAVGAVELVRGICPIVGRTWSPEPVEVELEVRALLRFVGPRWPIRASRSAR